MSSALTCIICRKTAYTVDVNRGGYVCKEHAPASGPATEREEELASLLREEQEWRSRLVKAYDQEKARADRFLNKLDVLRAAVLEAKEAGLMQMRVEEIRSAKVRTREAYSVLLRAVGLDVPEGEEK